MKRARGLTKELLRRVPSALRVGMTERSLSWRIEQWARELGAERMAFDTIVGFGSHTSMPHHRPTSRTLRKGHLVQIDLGIVYRGYCSDLSEVFFTARPSAMEEKVVGALKEAKKTATRAAVAGAVAADIDQAARRILRSYGLEEAFCHALGHGVGLEVHEGVTISPKSKDRLLPGEVITIEPGVYFPGKFGMRVEDMVFVE
ncbi:MAG: Xaa-Pro dipeptidase [Candidatus Peregrinibacteria bacterium Gr01-1014_25]|nr:MAG: Xaa-Pro dipeptidase [Candidatus Peregrinibacteria bacterium Gr01-1014_25]